ncbi:hypothetical protein DM867_05680 [Halosegnis rubeus]|uniref:Uncharacterized protein n=1 Tax=Halosegnis rubeus TaxID=2212850 RepID=A0A5N5U869_9EURY|nr:hypothetical protein [Halosegnis rubeus]KAB7514609.1 hypothetical protein DM867_05680 [Halosegnis rubeus]
MNDYFPHLHYQTAATLADQDYDLLVDYWGTQDTSLKDLQNESKQIETLVEGGAVDNIRELNLE